MTLFDAAAPSCGFPALGGLSWNSDPTQAQARAHEILVGLDDARAQLSQWLRSLSAEEIDHIVDRSVERSSHYKWYLGGSRKAYLVWLHQYRPSRAYEKANGFAASIHDHRLGFCSRVLSGSLRVTWYAAAVENGTARLTVLDRRRLSSGQVISMTSDEIHKIDDVEDNTLTLVVQGPAERHFSTVFDERNGTMQRFDDLDNLYSCLLDGLSP
jgi:hypothetical protein